MSDLRATVYVSWGLWVARCPTDGCQGAEHFGHAPITGHVGGLTQVGFACARCGLVCPAQWPANAEDIRLVLGQRPIVETRNWEPHETIEDLIAENAVHGLIQPPPGLSDGVQAVQLTTGGRLTDHAQALVSAGAARQIGA